MSVDLYKVMSASNACVLVEQEEQHVRLVAICLECKRHNG